MLRPRWRKVLSDLWSNRARSALVVASIAIGLFALGTIATIYYTVREDMRLGYAAANPANIQLSTSLFDQHMVDRIARLPGVKQTEGARNVSLRLQSAPGEWIAFNLRAVRDWTASGVNKLRPIAGQWPPQDRQLAIERYKFSDTNAHLGGTVTLEIPYSLTRQLGVVSLVNEQTLGSFQTGPSFFLAPAQGYVTQKTLEWLGQPRSDLYNTLYVVVVQNSEDLRYLRNFADQVSKELEKGGVTTNNIAVRGTYDHPNRIFTDAIAALLIVLGFLVVFLSGFLITNTLQALVAQQVQQIGIMKTVGARRRQISTIYMALIFIFSLVSILIAIPLAYEVAFGATSMLAGQINYVFQGKRWIPNAILLQVVVGVLVPQIAAFIPIWQGAQLTIQEALSGVRQDHLPYQDWISRWFRKVHSLSRPTLVALRNTIRRKGRLTLTLITLSLGGAVFIATFNVRNSMSEYVRQVSQYFLADINLSMSYPYRVEEIERVLARSPEIDYFEAWGAARADMYLDGKKDLGESVQMLAPPADTRLVKPVVLQGRWIQPGDENAITLNEVFLDSYPEIKVGDTLRLRINGKETRWIVVGFFRLAGKRTSLIGYTDYDTLSRLTGAPSQASVFRIVAKKPNMTEAEQKALGRDIEALLRQRGYSVAEVTAGSWLSSTAAQGFNVLTAFLLFLAILTALVGSIGLAGTMSMNVFERTREIGIMRAIGASNPILMRMVLLEGAAIGVISWGVAILLAIPISSLLYDSVSLAIFGVRTPVSLTLSGFIIWLGVVILLSILASLLPARNATSLTIREVLAYE